MKHPVYLLIRDTKNRLFFSNELRSIEGTGRRRTRLLVGFLFLSLVAISVANAGLEYLRDRMDSPYTKWVNIPVDKEQSDNYSSFKENLDTLEAQQAYQLEKVSGFYKIALKVYTPVIKPYQRTTFVRSINTAGDRVLWDALLDEENIISDGDFRKEDGSLTSRQKTQGVIVTEELLKNLGFEEDAYPRILISNGQPGPLDLHVIAVVRKLPDRSDMVCSYELMRSLRGSNDSGAKYAERSRLSFRIPNYLDVTEVEEIFRTLGDEYAYKGIEFEEPFQFRMEEISGCPSHPVKATIPLSEDYSQASLELLLDAIVDGTGRLKDMPIAYEYSIPAAGVLENSDDESKRPGSDAVNNNYHFFCLQFDEIEEVDGLREYLLQTTNYNISLERIESLRNFNLVSLLTRMLAVGLVFFTLVGLVLFITSMLSSHMESIRMNLGTFLAFGLSRSFLTRSYVQIIGWMVFKIVVIALALTFVLDLAGGTRLLDVIVSDEKQGLSNLFSVINSWNLICLLLFAFTAIYVTIRVVRKHLSYSPGDLIYNRKSDES